jgi:nicotinamidase-related amidase
MTAPATLDPRRTALLLMDLQNGIVGRFPGGEQVVARASGALAHARAAGLHVGWVRVAFREEDYARVPETNARFSGRRGMLDADDPATQIVDALEVGADDVVVRKTRVGAFGTTDLARQLAERGVDTLLLGGISTSGVVLSTVRDAADRDFRLYVLADLCADADEEVHRVLLEKVFPSQAEVIASAALEALAPRAG